MRGAARDARVTRAARWARWIRRRCDFPWTAAVCLIAIAATAAALDAPRIADAVIADARIAHGEPWRALTGPLVHATWGHLIRDLALVALAGCAYEAPLRSRRALLFLAGIAAPAIGVLAAGDVRWYCGLSGLSHALLAAALSYELGARRGAARAIAGALCAIAAAKPIYELITGAPAFAMSLGDGVVQVPLAHAIGAVIGAACGWLAAADRRRAPATPGDTAGTYPTRRAARHEALGAAARSPIGSPAGSSASAAARSVISAPLRSTSLLAPGQTRAAAGGAVISANSAEPEPG
jgi:rhomboid family GlyGly-CTERM serine protease